MRDLDPFRRQSSLVEKCLRLLQILLAEDAHADPLGLRLAAATLEHKAVVTGLGDAAEIERIAILVADDEAEEIHVEISACRQVADREHRMAGARDVERRTVDRLRNAHGALQPTLFESETFLEHGSMKWNRPRSGERSRFPLKSKRGARGSLKGLTRPPPR